MKFRYTFIAPVLIACLSAPVVADEDLDDEHHILDEIVVAATPLERTVEQLALPTSVLAGDALTKKQAASIGETLADELGVSASYFGPVASRPVIRGQFGERVRVLSNGLDSLDASALSEDHAVSIDSILAESVEVVRGPATLLYGSGAAGGIVNVVDTRIAEAPLDDTLSGAVALNADTAVGTRSGAIKVDFGTADIAYHLDWYRRDTDDIEIPGFAESRFLRELEALEPGNVELAEASGEVDNTSSEAEGGAAAVSLTGGDGFVGLAVSRYASNYGIPGHAHDVDPGAAIEAVRIDLDQTRYDIKAQYALQGFLQRAKLRVARNDYRHIELEGGETGTRFDTDGTDVRLELRHRPLGNWQGAFGFQVKTISFRAEGDEAYVPGSDTSQLGFFVFEELALSDAWVLQGSARFERQEIKTSDASVFADNAVGASLGSIWSLPRDLTLSANLSLTERHPNSTELYADGPHVAVQRYERGSVTLGAGVLKEEVSTNVDLTLRGAAERLEWTVTGFMNSIDDYILLAPTPLQIDELQVFEYEQQDVEMYGAEIEALVDLFEGTSGHLHARVFADYVYGEAKRSGEYLPRLPPLRWGVGLHFTKDNMDASVDVAFHDRQAKRASNESPTDSFTLLNVEASWTFEQPSLLVFLRGTNLGDDDARRHTSPLKDLVPLPGRSITLGLRLDF